MPPEDALPDLLAGRDWYCLSTEPGAVAEPSELGELSGDVDAWLPADVPGTAATAVRAAAVRAGDAVGAVAIAERDFDAEDWWFRTAFASGGDGPWRLHIGGLASIADVWLNGEHVLHSENMFRSHTLDVPALQSANELVIRCAALNPLLAKRRPRPRWKVARLRYQTQRWYRTTLLGRLTGWVATPAPVGPWRPVTLTPHTALRIEHKRVSAHCAAGGSGGSVSVQVRFAADAPLESATVAVAGVRAPLELTHADGVSTATGSVQLDQVERWWPHTHGTPARYPVTVQAGGRQFPLGQVGFRELTVDRTDGAFRVLVNGVEVFCRGAYWTPLDPVSLVDGPAKLRAALDQVRAANLNMIRIGGESVYPDEAMLSLLDELGIMLWQDCMFAFYDLPDDDDLAASIRAELSEQFGVLQPHACLAVLSGGGEIEQQAAFTGISAEQRAMSQFETVIPELAAELLDGVTYIPSSPTGGALPIQPRSGVAHYYGVGAYLRGVDDARRAGVRFAAECLAFATPPEPGTVEQACGGAARAGHHPLWKAAVYRDAGASWDFEDVRDHYTRELFGVEPSRVRWTDPERALDLGRATVAHLFEATWSEWRRAASTCAGALVFHYRDLAPGAGLGVVDALGRPKAPWYVMRRVLAPMAVLITDEGLNGLDAHVYNDRPEPLDAVLRVELFAPSGLRTESVQTDVSVPGHASAVVDLSGLFEGFRDLSYAHLFGPPAHDVLTATLCPRDESSDTGELGQAVFLVGGQARAVEQDLGLTAELSPVDTTNDSGAWRVTVRTRRFAQWVNLDIDGFIPADNWFHLAPESSRTIGLTASGDRPAPRGRVGALNVAASRSMSLVREA